MSFTRKFITAPDQRCPHLPHQALHHRENPDTHEAIHRLFQPPRSDSTMHFHQPPHRRRLQNRPAMFSSLSLPRRGVRSFNAPITSLTTSQTDERRCLGGSCANIHCHVHLRAVLSENDLSHQCCSSHRCNCHRAVRCCHQPELPSRKGRHI